MNKTNNRFSEFSKGLGKLQEVSGKAAVAPAAQTITTRSEGEQGATQPTRWEQQASRRGKVVISGYFDPVVRKQLAMLGIELEKTNVELLAEALNLLFEKHSRSPIAKA